MIGHTSQMTAKRNPLGPTGETVRANVIALRERKNLTYAELSGNSRRPVGRSLNWGCAASRKEIAGSTWTTSWRSPKHSKFGRSRCDAGNPIGGEPVQTGDELVQATCRPPEPAKFLWNQLQGLLIGGFGDTTDATLKGTADYRRFIDSTPPWAVEDALGKVYSGHD